jgi:hypothetical protein
LISHKKTEKQTIIIIFFEKMCFGEKMFWHFLTGPK